MISIIATGKDGVSREFYYEVEDDYTFYRDSTVSCKKIRVHADQMGSNEFFELCLADMEKCLQIVSISHNEDKRYIQMGIPEAIVYEMHKFLGRSIHSSKKGNHESKNEWRIPNADKYWKRLVDNNKAAYNENEDYFYTI